MLNDTHPIDNQWLLRDVLITPTLEQVEEFTFSILQ